MANIPWELSSTMQELNRGLDPAVLADLGYPVPDQYLPADTAPSSVVPKGAGEVAVGSLQAQTELLVEPADAVDAEAPLPFLIDGDEELTREWMAKNAECHAAAVAMAASRPPKRARAKSPRRASGGSSRPPFNATKKQVVDPDL